MEIPLNVKATNIELTSDISTYLEKRLSTLEKLINSTDTTAMFDVEVGRTTEHHQSGKVFRAEINLQMEGKELRAVAVAETIQTAIDKAKNEMKRELRRHKQKRLVSIRRGGASIKGFLRGAKDLQKHFRIEERLRRSRRDKK